MEDLFDTWCEASEFVDGRKLLWRASEYDGLREIVLDEIAKRTRSHYVSDDEIAVFLKALGYTQTAEVLETQYPQNPIGRSGDLGEILGTEVIEEWCEHEVPIRKLRDKDHREQAMRGEDMIGVKIDDAGLLCLLKGEAKSAQSLSTSTVEDARSALESNQGRPSAHALVFTARRLVESDDPEQSELGKRLLAESVQNAVPKTRLAHLLFAFTGNVATSMLDDDFDQADGERDQYIIQLRAPDHAALVEAVFNRVNDLALD